MCCYDKGFFVVSLVPEGKQADLFAGVLCSKLPNLFLQLLEQYWVICLFSKVKVVNNFSCRFPLKTG
jgi:hypothetical protein